MAHLHITEVTQLPECAVGCAGFQSLTRRIPRRHARMVDCPVRDVQGGLHSAGSLPLIRRALWAYLKALELADDDARLQTRAHSLSLCLAALGP